MGRNLNTGVYVESIATKGKNGKWFFTEHNYQTEKKKYYVPM